MRPALLAIRSLRLSMTKTIFLAANAALMPLAAGSSQATEQMRASLVLVHGAFADEWNKVIPLLQAKGIEVLSVQNPLTSVEDDVAFTRRSPEYAISSLLVPVPEGRHGFTVIGPVPM
jgi:hypothetical protein